MVDFFHTKSLFQKDKCESHKSFEITLKPCIQIYDPFLKHPFAYVKSQFNIL